MAFSFGDWRRRTFPDPFVLLVGLAVMFISLVLYLMTVQRSVPFWDCGEFIACSHILGIPHPPGTPLFVLLGRVFSILPLASDISLRVNLMSPISGALAAMLASFVVARFITWWYVEEYPTSSLDLSQRLSVYAGSFTGGLLFAFAATNWSNSVEAEVYSTSMLLIVALIWLTVIWAQRREDPDSDRYLIAMSFLAFLSIGIHLTVFLVMPPIFLAVALLSERLRRDWRFWITSIILAMVMVRVIPFLWAVSLAIVVFGLVSAHRHWGAIGIAWTVITWGIGVFGTITIGEPWPVFVTALVWSVGIIPWTRTNRQWGLMFALLVVGLLGYSTHAFIPIRAQHEPAINENEPKTWDAFDGFLERKQYGQQSMFQRALKRRGEWSNQLGQHRRMGFWGFFDQQYGFNDALFLPVFFLGLVGIAQVIRRRKILGLMFLVLLLISSVGLVWYMNFADGTKYNPAIQDAYLEVRDRDYFFTPAFVLFGMAIGLGGAALVRWVSGGHKIWPITAAILVALMPLRAIQANYDRNDRSNNYIPYDYAHNILMSADENALMFTNGDNDTFPVWCLQEVYGVRKDVRIINLSLLNTHWYIKQLKNFHDVPIDLSDSDIDRLVHYREPDGSLHRVQDQMIDVILTSNKGKYPVNFAVTVTPSNREFKGQSIEDHLEMVGMAYRLVPQTGNQMVDIETLQERLESVFQYRGVADPEVHKDETARRMVQNYSTSFFLVADSLRRANDLDGAAELMNRAIDMFGNQWEPYVYLLQLYTELRDFKAIENVLARAEMAPVDLARVRLNTAYAFRRLDSLDRAEELFLKTYKEEPHNESAFKALVQFYYDMERYDTLLSTISGWMVDHPTDSATQQLLTQAQALAKARDTASTSLDTPADTLLP